MHVNCNTWTPKKKLYNSKFNDVTYKLEKKYNIICRQLPPLIQNLQEKHARQIFSMFTLLNRLYYLNFLTIILHLLFTISYPKYIDIKIDSDNINLFYSS